MTDLVTLLTIRNLAKQRSDNEFSSFIADTEWNQYINDSNKELYDLIISGMQDYQLTQANVTIASGTNTSTLPTDFYKIRGLDYVVGSQRIEVPKFNFEERNYRDNSGYFSTVSPSNYGPNISGLAWRLVGNTLFIDPRDQAAGNYILWYIPVIPALVADADTLDCVMGWHEYTVIDAAIKARAKEESSVTELLQAKDDMKKRILKSLIRTPSHPDRVSRTRTSRDMDGFRRYT